MVGQPPVLLSTTNITTYFFGYLIQGLFVFQRLIRLLHQFQASIDLTLLANHVSLVTPVNLGVIGGRGGGGCAPLDLKWSRPSRAEAPSACCASAASACPATPPGTGCRLRSTEHLRHVEPVVAHLRLLLLEMLMLLLSLAPLFVLLLIPKQTPTA